MKNPVALRGSRSWLEQGWLVTLQILLPLAEDTYGSSGQCVSFSIIDEGSGFTAYVVFFFYSDGL